MAGILNKADLALHIVHNERQLHAQTHTHGTLSLSLSLLHFLSSLFCTYFPSSFWFFYLLTASLPSHILTHTFSLPLSPASLPDNSIINWPI